MRILGKVDLENAILLKDVEKLLQKYEGDTKPVRKEGQTEIEAEEE